MYRLTKDQATDRDRIRAWLEGACELTVEEVLAKFVPFSDPAETGQHFTPLEMGNALLDLVNIPNGSLWAEFGAGIGNLAYHLEGLQIKLDCYEADQTCVQIGRKLFPWANWRHASPFQFLADIQGRYDFVIANPPIGSTWALDEALKMSAGKAQRSEHLFLELIVRSLKTDGQALVVGPANMIETMPPAMRDWFEARMDLNQVVELPGEFRLTKIKVVGFHFTRLEYQEAEVTGLPVMPAGRDFAAIFNRDALRAALWRVGQAIGPNQFVPVLRNVLLRSDGDQVELVGTNLGVRVRTSVKAEQVRPGSITVPYIPFFELSKRMPGQYITLVQGDEPDENGMMLEPNLVRLSSRGGFTNNARLKGIEAEQFPAGPVIVGKEFEVNGPKLTQMLNQVKHYVGRDKSRPLEQSVLFQIKDGQASMLAVNGFSLALTKNKIAQDDLQVAVPWPVLLTASKLWGSGTVKITLSEKNVRFVAGNVEIIGYIENDKRPDYLSIIPKQVLTTVLVDRTNLLRAVRRMRVVSDKSDGWIKLAFTGNGDGSGRVTLSANGIFMGDSVEELPAVVEGPAVTVEFGGRQISTALYAARADEAEFRLNGDENPVSIEMGPVLQVLMPKKPAP